MSDEGTVNRVMGDGIMALFGAPVAHEDHAARACYPALRMQESAERYAAELLGVSGRIRLTRPPLLDEDRPWPGDGAPPPSTGSAAMSLLRSRGPRRGAGPTPGPSLPGYAGSSSRRSGQPRR